MCVCVCMCVQPSFLLFVFCHSLMCGLIVENETASSFPQFVSLLVLSPPLQLLRRLQSSIFPFRLLPLTHFLPLSTRPTSQSTQTTTNHSIKCTYTKRNHPSSSCFYRPLIIISIILQELALALTTPVALSFAFSNFSSLLILSLFSR